MSSLKIALDHLETRLQTLVEGSAARLFSGGTAQLDIISGVLRAMQAGVHPGLAGAPAAPNEYILLTDPETAARLRRNAEFLEELAGLLRQACQEAGLALSGPLSLNVEAYAHQPVGEIQVIARDSLQNVTPTAALLIPDTNTDTAPGNAFLIVDGVTVFPLELPVINIGRRPDNQLVIDDARVSRLHAQLRLVRSRFVIFDLESTGGTFVNGRRIHQQTLYPGDVISLAGLPLVFGQDAIAPTDTQEIPVTPL